MTSNFDQVVEFHKAFGLELGPIREQYPQSLLDLREKLNDEEWNEAKDELVLAWRLGGEVNLPNLVKELTDTLVVTYGFLAALGVDANHAFRMVMESNMSKLGEDGKPVYRADGKVLKGPNFKDVDYDTLVKPI